MSSPDEWLIALDTEMVLRSGAAEMLDTAMVRRPGPKRSITWLGFLVVLRLTVRQKLFTLSDMARIFMSLPAEVQQRFGLPTVASRNPTKPGRAPRAIADKVLDDLQSQWRALWKELDDSPVTRPYLDPEDRARAEQLRVRLCDALASDWLPRITHDAHVEDGTAIDSFRNRRVAGDPHARLGHRTPTDREIRDSVFGFLLVCIEPARTGSGIEPPYVVLHHELVPANEHEGVVSLRIYERHAAHCPLGQVVDDRFVSYDPVDYSLRIVELGGTPLHDLHENLLGQRGMQHGFRVIDAWLWHPDLPPEYWNLRYHAGQRSAGAYRSHFAVKLLSGPQNQHPSEVLVGCPGREHGEGRPAQLMCPHSKRHNCTTVPNAPSVPRCAQSPLCTSADGVRIALAGADGTPTTIGRAFQYPPRLSPEWFARYPRIRSHIENSFSALTTPTGANLADRTHYIWGLPGTSLWVAHGIAIHNHKKLYTALASAGEDHLEVEDRERLQGDILYAEKDQLRTHYARLFPGDLGPS